MIFKRIGKLINHIYSLILMKKKGVIFKSFTFIGKPYFKSNKRGKIILGNNIYLNNTFESNPIGLVNPCSFVTFVEGEIKIGNNVGMSSVSIVSQKSVTVGNNVLIGGGVCIYDTDFHSVNPNLRNTGNDLRYAKAKDVIIEDNVFIGTRSIILKGVTIGENSIIGAGSVVTKNVPKNEIWAGNPAKFIKRVNLTND